MGVAAYYDIVDKARILLSAGWKSDDGNSSHHRCPLHDAYENEDLINFFVEECKQDINAPDAKGRNALYLASQSSRGQVLLMLKHHANPMIVNDDNGETSLHAAAESHDSETFEKMITSEYVPPLSDLKYQLSTAGDSIFDMAVSSDNTAVVKYLLEAKDSPFRSVEESSAGAKSLQVAIQNNFQDTTRVLLERVKEDVKDLTDHMKRQHLGTLLEAVFQNLSSSLADKETMSKELLLIFAETPGNDGMASREAWQYFLIFDAIMAGDPYKEHARHPFPQLETGVGAQLRDYNGWTYPDLVDTMKDMDSDANSVVSDTGNLPRAEERLLYGLEEVLVHDEHVAFLASRPKAPRLPTSWSVALSHKRLAWSRPAVLVDSDAAKESVVEEPKSDEGGQPKHFIACPPDESYHGYLAIADYPIPPNSKYHFSLLVVNEGAEKMVGTGVAYRTTPNNRMPGFDHGTWGYHGDDGGFFHDSGYAKCFDEECPYGNGKTVHVYVDMAEHKLFFAVGGQVRKTGFQNVYGRLYPAVGLGNGVSVEATFSDANSKDPFIGDDGKPLMDQVSEWY